MIHFNETFQKTFWWDILTRHFDKTFWWEILMKIFDETKIVKAHLAGRSVIVEMDSNSKLGNTYITNDPHTLSSNGKILPRIIDNNVANNSSKCIGFITRKRITKDRTETNVAYMFYHSADTFRSVLHWKKRASAEEKEDKT